MRACGGRRRRARPAAGSPSRPNPAPRTRGSRAAGPVSGERGPSPGASGGARGGAESDRGGFRETAARSHPRSASHCRGRRAALIFRRSFSPRPPPGPGSPARLFVPFSKCRAGLRAAGRLQTLTRTKRRRGRGGARLVAVLFAHRREEKKPTKRRKKKKREKRKRNRNCCACDFFCPRGENL